MKITYDPEADALYIELHTVERVVDGMDVEEGVAVDFDDSGHIVGLEILDASERLTLDELSTITYEDLVTEKRAELRLPVTPAPFWKKGKANP